MTSTPLPRVRPRRLRETPALRRLVSETRLHPAELVLPLFVREGVSAPMPIASMPGVVQHSLESLPDAVDEAAAAGVGGVMLFGVPEVRDARGSGATDPDGILNVATRVAVEASAGRLVVQTDLCLDEFTDHGHCGVLDEHGRVDNDATLERYRAMGLEQARAGSQLLGLSGMMDGQVAAVRDALDDQGRTDVAILAYSAKYASALYGPFRDAAECAPQFGDRRSYQMDPPNAREALEEVGLDLAEGADMVMIKPALAYLDIIRRVADSVTVPVAAYQVSGEFAMVEAAAASGWLDRDRIIFETLTAIRRAGASVILTYWAAEVARRLAG